jgi:hypothetical protein
LIADRIGAISDSGRYSSRGWKWKGRRIQWKLQERWKVNLFFWDTKEGMGLGWGHKRLILCVSVPVTVARAAGGERPGESLKLQSITRQWVSTLLLPIRFKSRYYLGGGGNFTGMVNFGVRKSDLSAKTLRFHWGIYSVIILWTSTINL